MVCYFWHCAPNMVWMIARISQCTPWSGGTRLFIRREDKQTHSSQLLVVRGGILAQPNRMSEQVTVKGSATTSSSCFERSRCLSRWHKHLVCASTCLSTLKGKRKRAKHGTHFGLSICVWECRASHISVILNLPILVVCHTGTRGDPTGQWISHVAACLCCACVGSSSNPSRWKSAPISKCLVRGELPGIHPRLRAWARRCGKALCVKKTVQCVHGKTQLLRCNYGTHFRQAKADHVVVKGLFSLAAGEITEGKGKNRGFPDWGWQNDPLL